MDSKNGESKIEALWDRAKAAGMSRRKFLGLLAGSGAAAVLAACTPKATPTTPVAPSPTTVPSTTAAPKPSATTTAPATTSAPATTAPAKVWNDSTPFPEKTVVLSSSAGATNLAAMAAMAPILQKYLGVPVRTTPMEQVKERYDALRDGGIVAEKASWGSYSLAIVGSGTNADAGEGPHLGRWLWNFYIPGGGSGYYVRGDDKSMNALTAADLKGKKISLGIYSQTSQDMMYALLAYANIKESDVVMVPFGSATAACASIAAGTADIAWANTALAVVLEGDAGPHGLKFLDVDPANKEAWARMLKIIPYMVPGLMPSLQGRAKASWGKWGFWSPAIWSTHPKASEELIYRMARVFGERFAEYKDLFVDYPGANMKYMRWWLDATSAIPHAGVVRYLREKGIWTADDDKWNQELLGIEQQYLKAWDAATKEGAAKKMTIDSTNKEWMALWDSYRTKLPQYVFGRGKMVDTEAPQKF